MKAKKTLVRGIMYVSILLFSVIISSCVNDQSTSTDLLYDLGTGIESRSASFENPTGEPGEGGKTASNLGVGRKGFPAKLVEPGETVTLCEVEGSGTIRHIWMTGGFKDNPIALRAMVVPARPDLLAGGVPGNDPADRLQLGPWEQRRVPFVRKTG